MAYGEAFLGGFLEVGGQVVFVRRRGVVLADWGKEYRVMSTLWP